MFLPDPWPATISLRNLVSRSARWIAEQNGNILIFTGIAHCVLGFFEYKDPALQMFRAGMLNTAEISAETSRFFWFEMSGILFVFVGLLIQRDINEYKRPVPRRFAYHLAAIGLSGCLLMPVSGFYVFIVISIPALLIRRSAF